jgi:para-aminobenzoate synthetase
VAILLIDNYDSFTFNLHQLIAEVYGEAPVVVRNDDPALAMLHLQDFDGVVLSPGPGHPGNARDFGACGEIIQADVPILGVCLGHQGLCHTLGGRVDLAPKPMHGRVSAVHHTADGLFRGVPSPFRAVRYHSLAAVDVPDQLSVTAWSDDGVVMGVAHRDRPVFGVQFHPESVSSEYGKALIENFRTLTQDRTPPRGGGAAQPPPRGAVRPARTQASTEPAALRVLWRKIEGIADPDEAFKDLFGDSSAAFWLDGEGAQPNTRRFSFMGDDAGPLAAYVTHDVWTRTVTVRDGDGVRHIDSPLLDYLDDELKRRATAAADLPFEFNLGYVGYLGYELKAECGGDRHHRSAMPDAALLFADRVVAFDREEEETYLLCFVEGGATADAERWIDMTAARLRCMRPWEPMPEGRTSPQTAEASTRARHDPEDYLSLIGECQRLIRRGESYEVCLTNREEAEVSADPVQTYQLLRRASPAPYSALLVFPDLAVVCSSPERFLEVSEAGLAESKPIKGTAPRGVDQVDDAYARDSLLGSEKERAENLMIVDLVRNDLGAVCDIGSVRVPSLFDIESYATVHQLVSTVQGQLAAHRSAIDCVRAAFPGGSMTGAPKKRTMEIIDRLEGGSRGVYSGALGWFGLSGAVDLGMVIRTIVIAEGSASYGVGGAITTLSDPDSELEETRVKGAALARVLAESADGLPVETSLTVATA